MGNTQYSTSHDSQNAQEQAVGDSKAAKALAIYKSDYRAGLAKVAGLIGAPAFSLAAEFEAQTGSQAIDPSESIVLKHAFKPWVCESFNHPRPLKSLPRRSSSRSIHTGAVQLPINFSRVIVGGLVSNVQSDRRPCDVGHPQSGGIALNADADFYVDSVRLCGSKWGRGLSVDWRNATEIDLATLQSGERRLKARRLHEGSSAPSAPQPLVSSSVACLLPDALWHFEAQSLPLPTPSKNNALKGRSSGQQRRTSATESTLNKSTVPFRPTDFLGSDAPGESNAQTLKKESLHSLNDSSPPMSFPLQSKVPCDGLDAADDGLFNYNAVDGDKGGQLMSPLTSSITGTDRLVEARGRKGSLPGEDAFKVPVLVLRYHSLVTSPECGVGIDGQSQLHQDTPPPLAHSLEESFLEDANNRLSASQKLRDGSATALYGRQNVINGLCLSSYVLFSVSIAFPKSPLVAPTSRGHRGSSLLASQLLRWHLIEAVGGPSAQRFEERLITHEGILDTDGDPYESLNNTTDGSLGLLSGIQDGGGYNVDRERRGVDGYRPSVEVVMTACSMGRLLDTWFEKDCAAVPLYWVPLALTTVDQALGYLAMGRLEDGLRCFFERVRPDFETSSNSSAALRIARELHETLPQAAATAYCSYLFTLSTLSRRRTKGGRFRRSSQDNVTSSRISSDKLVKAEAPAVQGHRIRCVDAVSQEVVETAPFLTSLLPSSPLDSRPHSPHLILDEQLSLVTAGLRLWGPASRVLATETTQAGSLQIENNPTMSSRSQNTIEQFNVLGLLAVALHHISSFWDSLSDEQRCSDLGTHLISILLLPPFTVPLKLTSSMIKAGSTAMARAFLRSRNAALKTFSELVDRRSMVVLSLLGAGNSDYESILDSYRGVLRNSLSAFSSQVSAPNRRLGCGGLNEAPPTESRRSTTSSTNDSELQNDGRSELGHAGSEDRMWLSRSQCNPDILSSLISKELRALGHMVHVVRLQVDPRYIERIFAIKLARFGLKEDLVKMRRRSSSSINNDVGDKRSIPASRVKCQSDTICGDALHGDQDEALILARSLVPTTSRRSSWLSHGQQQPQPTVNRMASSEGELEKGLDPPGLLHRAVTSLLGYPSSPCQSAGVEFMNFIELIEGQFHDTEYGVSHASTNDTSVEMSLEAVKNSPRDFVRSGVVYRQLGPCEIGQSDESGVTVTPRGTNMDDVEAGVVEINTSTLDIHLREELLNWLKFYCWCFSCPGLYWMDGASEISEGLYETTLLQTEPSLTADQILSILSDEIHHSSAPGIFRSANIERSTPLMVVVAQ